MMSLIEHNIRTTAPASDWTGSEMSLTLGFLVEVSRGCLEGPQTITDGCF